MNSSRYLISRGALSVTNHFKLNKICIGGSFRSFSVTKSRNMKILQFTYKNKPEEMRVGFLDGENVVDMHIVEPTLPTTLIEILKKGCPGCRLFDDGSKEEIPASAKILLSSVNLKAPITGMDKVLCVGLNYKDHCSEQKLTPPPVPMFFSKFASSVVGPDEPVRLRTDVTQKVDWEVELVVVMGTKASGVKAVDAYKHVLGYTIAQDISARDWQKERNMGQFLLGKSMDTFCPLGPWITTHDEIGDPQSLDISCSINGVQKQKSRTDQLVHKIPDIIERVSSVMTLLPGDVILTGTPGGVGMYRQPAEYLRPGDVITNQIEKIGELTVRVENF